MAPEESLLRKWQMGRFEEIARTKALPTSVTPRSFDCLIGRTTAYPRKVFSRPRRRRRSRNAQSQHLDVHSEKCLLVVKNGLTTGTTVGRVNGLQSFTRYYDHYNIHVWLGHLIENHPGDTDGCCRCHSLCGAAAQRHLLAQILH
ncbi:hypothetical protein GGR54DRAFT_360288 [Hypoxylon sp. NC1633]|nr:hypothetical protein GGR54DRAFT_360288 [Hypoxylon sp. NC1633]